MDLQKWSFHWHGRSKQGVHKWSGNAEGPPRLLGIGFLGYGALALAGGLICGVLRLTGVAGAGVNTVIVVGLIHGLLFPLIGWWMLRQRAAIARLAPAEKLSATLCVSDDTLAHIAEEKGIKPRLIINDRPLYDPADFSDAQILLRGSSAPASPETLLRAAVGHAVTTPQNELLRSVVPEAGDTPAHAETWAASEPEAVQTLNLRNK